jgi:hypothetical protein
MATRAAWEVQPLNIAQPVKMLLSNQRGLVAWIGWRKAGWRCKSLRLGLVIPQHALDVEVFCPLRRPEWSRLG